jgi:hypothetical protein
VSTAARHPLARIPIAQKGGAALAAFGYVSGHYRTQSLYCFHFNAAVVVDNSSPLIFAPPFAKNCLKFKRSHSSKAFLLERDETRRKTQKN